MLFAVAKKIKRRLFGYDKVVDQLEKLKKLPRYQPGEFFFHERRLTFPDAFSFVSIFAELFYKEAYRFETKNENPFIIDCGANIGLSAIYFLKSYPHARIIAFEPDTKIYRYLENNLKAWGYTNVELHNTAVWKEETALQFKNEGSDAGRIAFEKDASQFAGVTEIKTVKLSSYITSQVDFLKIDIEGAEIEVMQEIEPVLYWVDHLFLEYHSFVNARQELDKILTILTRNGFEYYLDIPCVLRNRPFVENGSFLSYNLLVNIYAKKIA